METEKQQNATPEDILAQLKKARQELSTLYEISNAMHKTLELEQILFIILTGVTSHSGLGFNRAMLLLLDPQGKCLDGKMGVGPDSGEEAGRIWRLIDEQQMGLDDLVNSYASTRQALSASRFFNQVRALKVCVREPEGGILAKAFFDGMPFHIKQEHLGNFASDPLFSVFHSEEFVVVPLKARDKTIGLVVADNFFTKRPITKDDIRVLMMFANQAGMAIENSQLYERAIVKSHKDSLTDLWNHGYFQFCLEEKLKHAKEHMPHLSVILADLDDFKCFNDTWGHQKGDEALVKISRIITESSRRVDFVCRYGGEEFAVILPDASPRDASVIAERIRSNIENAALFSDPALKITVSIGVASFPGAGNSKDELIRTADEALYGAKRSGKNKVVNAPPKF